MASVVLVTLGPTFFVIDYIRDIVEDLGHTFTTILDSTVDASNLSAHDVIINYAIGAGVDEVALAGFYDNYMSVDGISILWAADHNGGLPVNDDNFVTGDDFAQCILGVNARNYRNRYAGGVDPEGYGVVVPVAQYASHEVSMELLANANILGAGFLQPNFQGTFGGESFVSGDDRIGGATNGIAVVPPGDAQVAGTKIVRLKNSFWGDTRESAACVYEAGDARVGADTGTFPTRGARIDGMTWTRWSRNQAQMFRDMVRWCVGDFDAITTYPALGGFRYKSFALDDLNGTTYGSSTISWTEVTPGASAITLSAALDGENFTTVSNGGAIPGLSASDPLAGLRLTIKVAVTSSGSDTPSFSDLEVILLAQQDALTASPADYFQEGHLLWTSGANNGQSMEVKSYDDGTKAVKLFLTMRDTIAVGDKFTILPGCDKKIGTCNTKFANSVNFQGEPNVPGEDFLLKVPDAP